MDATQTRRRRLTVLLIVGFLALAGAAWTARRSPATDWELSIYHATPWQVWVGLAVAVLAAMLVAVHAPRGSYQRFLALVLAPTVVVTVLALPVLRGYYYFGAGDALSYLGWTRMIAEGRLNPIDLLYPGMKGTAVFVAGLVNVSLRRGLMYVVLVFLAAYLLFIPLCVRRVARGDAAFVAGTATALLLLPINNVHVYSFPYPTTMIIFFLPFVLYLLLTYVTDDRALLRVRGHAVATPTGVLLALAGVAAILLHPQGGANVVLVVWALLGVQVIARLANRRRWRGRTGRIVDLLPKRFHVDRLLHVQAAIVTGFFLLWAPRFDQTTGTMSAALTGLLTGSAPADEITQRASSLAVLESSIFVIFAKIFLVSAILSVIAGAVMLAVAAGRSGDDPNRRAALAYLTVGFVPVSVMFVVFFLASITVQPFRYLGYMMVFVTILAAVGISDGIPVSFRRISRPNRRTLAVAAFVVLLVPQMLIVFHSPYIYKAADHVTEPRMEGYETAFEHRDPSIYFAGVRGGPRRYVDATYGTTYSDTTPDGRVFPGKEAMIPFAVFGNNMTEYYSNCRYVPISQVDYEREVVMYEGFRYSAEGFAAMTTTPNVHRVTDSRGFDLYVVDTGAGCTT